MAAARGAGVPRQKPDQLNPSEARTRLRAAVRRVVSEVWCLFVGEGGRALTRNRLAAVQLWFNGGGCRDYLIVHRRSVGGSIVSPGGWWVRSLPARGGKGGADLRVRESRGAVGEGTGRARCCQVEAGFARRLRASLVLDLPFMPAIVGQDFGTVSLVRPRGGNLKQLRADVCERANANRQGVWVWLAV